MSASRTLPAAFALLVLFAATWFCARHRYEDGRFAPEPAQALSGDEPHYLLTVNSLLFDRDLSLGDDYRRARWGGLEAGRNFSGKPLDHHTIVVDRATGEHLVWSELYDLTPGTQHFCRTAAAGCEDFARKSDRLRGPSAVERPLHAPLWPAAVALALAPLRLTRAQVEPAMGALLLLISWLGGAVVTYLCARRAGLSEGHAVAAAALVCLCSPWLAYSRAYFAETSVGLVLALGVLALLCERPLLAAALAGLAGALKPQYAPFGPALIAAQTLRASPLPGRVRTALGMSAVVACFALATFAWNRWLIGVPVVVSQGFAWVPWLRSLPQALVDSRHGLLPFAPWALISLAGAARGLSARPPPLLRETGLPIVANLVLLSSNGWFGEWCYGPRYWVAYLPLLALAAAGFAAAHGALLRSLLVALALAGALFAVSGALEYRYVFHQPAWLALGAFG